MKKKDRKLSYYFLRTAKYYKPYFVRVVLSGFLAISMSLLTLAFPFGFGKIVDELSTKRFDVAIYWIITLVFAAFFRELLSCIGSNIYSNLNNQVLCDIRHDMFCHALLMPMAYFDHEKQGNIVSLFASDVNAIQSVSANAIFSLITDALTLSTILTTLFLTNWKVASFSLIALILYVVVLRKQSSLRGLSKLSQENIANSMAILSETLSGIRTIKLISHESESIKTYDNNLSEWHTINKKLVKERSILQSVIGLITVFGPYAILALGVYYISVQELSIGVLITIYTLLGQLYAPCRNLTNLNAVLQIGVASLSRIFQFMDLPSDKSPCPKTFSLDDIHSVEFNCVAFSYYNEKSVLDNLTFSIQKGERVAIVGESGSGKSTIAELLLKLYRPVNGEILVNGVNIQEISTENLRQEIGIVSQDVFLFSGTVSENIKFAHPEATDEEMLQASRIAGADEFIQLLPNKYNSQIGDRGVQLSMGQRQRISIARTILAKPSLIILDEATSALDATTQQHVQNEIEQYFCEHTCLIIAHRLNTVRRCDRILVLRDGCIIEQGSFNTLINQQGAFWELYKKESS